MQYAIIREQAELIKTQEPERIPELLHYTVEKFDMSPEEETLLYEAIRDERALERNAQLDDEVLTEQFFEMYAHLRAIGATPEDAGRALGISPQRMKRILAGSRVLNPRLHKRLYEIELGAPVARKIKALKVVDDKLEEGSYKAAITTLERCYGGEWRPVPSEPSVVNNVKINTNEERALKAAERLKELRAQRATEDDLK